MKYKNNTNTAKPKKKIYPSDCGSHKSMVNDEYEAFNTGDHEFIVCKDDRGSYVTLKNILDNGLMDSNRTVDLKTREIQFGKYLK